MAKRILIIEDNAQNRILLKDVLEFHGFEVLEAENGLEGVRRAREHRPDLILLDIQMPVMNGFGAIAALRDDPATRGVKIIALTSFAMKGDREKIMAAGFDGYIAKPFDTRELPALVKHFLGGGRT